MYRILLAALASAGVIAPQLRGGDAQQIRILAVTSANDFSPAWPVSGGLGTVFCTGLTGTAGVRIEAGAAASAPVLAVADFGEYQQVNFQMPWEAGAKPHVAVWQGGVRSAPVEPPPHSDWSVLFKDYRTGAALAQYAADYSLVSPANPARPGEWIIVYASNLGAVSPQPATGVPASAAPLSRLLDGSVAVLLGERGAENNYIGLAPGVLGVYQINLRVPSGTAAGLNTLVLTRMTFCGFFFTPGCGRGFVTQRSTGALMPVAVE